MNLKRFVIGNHRRIISLLIISVLLSCTTLYEFEVDVLTPATIHLPEVQQVIVINRTHAPRYDKKANYFRQADSMVHINDQVASQAVRSLNQVLNDSPKYQSQIITIAPQHNQGRIAPPATNELIDSLCQAHNADAVISLDQLIYTDELGLYKSQQPWIVSEGRIKATMQVKISYTWRTYLAGKARVADRLNQRDSSQWQEYFMTTAEARHYMPDRSQTALQAGKVIGELYGLRIAPLWNKEKRMMYVNHPKLSKGQQAAFQDQWQSAAKYWRPWAESDKRLLSEYASYNMAVAAEMMGKLDIALGWAKKAHGKYGTDESKQYIKTLNQRIEQEKLLNQQLN